MHSLNFHTAEVEETKEKNKESRLGTVSGNNVDVTVGVPKGIWLCRYPGVHQHKQCLSETEGIEVDKAAFDGSLSAVLVDAAENTEATKTPGRHISDDTDSAYVTDLLALYLISHRFLAYKKNLSFIFLNTCLICLHLPDETPQRRKKTSSRYVLCLNHEESRHSEIFLRKTKLNRSAVSERECRPG